MKNILIIIAILVSLTGCIFLPPPTKLGILKSHESITSSYFAEDVPYSCKIKNNFLKNKIVVLGLCSLAIIDKDNVSKRQIIPYEIRSSKPDLIKINGKMHVLAGGGGFSDVGLMNENGKLIWKYKLDPNKLMPPYAMVAGDLNNDGRLEFYAGTYDGLHILDKDGKLLKIVPPSDLIYELEICTYNKKPVIIANTSFQGEQRFRFYDFNGNLLKTIDNKKGVKLVKIINWHGEDHILAFRGNIYIYDLNGNIVIEKNPGVPIWGLNGTAVYFKENSRPYLAVVVRYSSRYNRSLLCIFSPEGELIYQEVLYDTTAITAIKDQKTNRESLLVGGGYSADDRIMIKKYEMPIR